jgi:hypothetical protein
MIVGGGLFLTGRGLDIKVGPIILTGTFPMGTFPTRVAGHRSAGGYAA